MSPARSDSEHLENRLAFETLISDLSSRFINLPAREADREITDALRRVCDLLTIDLAVLWQWSVAAPGVISPTHFYAREGLLPPGPLSQDMFPWYRQQMLDGCLVAIASLEEFPAAAAVDRESCRLVGVKSNLTLPLAVGGEPPLGALGFIAMRAKRDWPDALVKRLQLVAQVFTNALARRRHESRLQESEERLSLAADSAEAGRWTMPLSANIILRNFGLTVFLAQIGMTVGPRFLETVQQTGLLFLGLGAAIVLVAVLFNLLVGHFVFRFRIDELLGATSGVAANPAIAVFASKLTASDRTDVAYAMTFPTSTIMKIVLIQVMLAMMGQS